MGVGLGILVQDSADWDLHTSLGTGLGVGLALVIKRNGGRFRKWERTWSLT